jgi:hypothetical protein
MERSTSTNVSKPWSRATKVTVGVFVAVGAVVVVYLNFLM